MPQIRQEGGATAWTRLVESAHTILAGLSEEVDLQQAGQSAITSTELQALDDLICDSFKLVRGIINTFRPINQLPPEVLLLIFALIPDDLATHVRPLWRSFRSHCMADVRPLCPVTAVCRHWRNLALSTSSLWSCAYDQCRDVSPAHHGNYIDRCKGGPLYICIEGHASDTTMALIQRCSDRVRELYIDAFHCRTAEKNNLSLIATMPLENIEQCTIYDFDPPLPNLKLFNGHHCPQLRTLRLYATSIFPSSPIPSLTHLAITYPQHLPHFMTRLLNVLNGCPALEELYLDDFTFSQSSLSVSDWRGGPINLHNLERLFLREPLNMRSTPQVPDPTTDYISSLLPLLAIPASCIVCLLAHLPASGLQPCVKGLVEEARIPATHLYIHGVRLMKKSSVYQLRVVNTAQRQYTLVDVAVFRREFRFPESVGQQELFDALPLALAQLPLFSRIRELYFYSGEGAVWHDSHQRPSIFSALPHLQTLILDLHHPTCARQLLVALQVPMPLDPHAPPEVCCPRLSTIVVSSSFKDATYMRWLARTRATAGFPLDRLLLDIRRRSYTKMSEYNARGEFVRFLTEEEAIGYRLPQKAAEILPASCRTWADI